MVAIYDQFLLFGDSITQHSSFGLAAPLQAACIRHLDVVNRGFSGYNTKMALKVLPSIIPSPDQARIRFMYVFFGANDASLPDAPNKQHVPISEYKRNLETIITHPLVVAHKPRIILVAPPPINEHSIMLANPGVELARVAATTKMYAEAVCELGEKLGLPVVNLWKVFMAKTGWTDAWKPDQPLPGSMSVAQHDALVELLSDGLHFNPAGYAIFFKELMKVFSENWPEQLPENLKPTLPEWNDTAAWEAFDTTSSKAQ